MADTIRIGDRDVPVRDCWRTPQWLIDRLDARWRFGLDAAATAATAITPSNRVQLPYLGLDHELVMRRDALRSALPWGLFSTGDPVFCNPPYSQASGGLTRWVEAFVRDGAHTPVVAIVPDTPACRWFRRAWETAAEVTLFDGRVGFDPPEGIKASSPRGGVAVFVWAPRFTGPARVRWDSVPERSKR